MARRSYAPVDIQGHRSRAPGGQGIEAARRSPGAHPHESAHENQANCRDPDPVRRLACRGRLTGALPERVRGGGARGAAQRRTEETHRRRRSSARIGAADCGVCARRGSNSGIRAQKIRHRARAPTTYLDFRRQRPARSGACQADWLFDRAAPARAIHSKSGIGCATPTGRCCRYSRASSAASSSSAGNGQPTPARSARQRQI